MGLMLKPKLQSSDQACNRVTKVTTAAADNGQFKIEHPFKSSFRGSTVTLRYSKDGYEDATVDVQLLGVEGVVTIVPVVYLIKTPALAQTLEVKVLDGITKQFVAAAVRVTKGHNTAEDLQKTAAAEGRRGRL